MICPREEDLAPFSQETHELSAKTLIVKFLTKANLALNARSSDVSKTREIAHNAKSCTKLKKLLEIREVAKKC